MRHIDELEILDHLGKGIRAKENLFCNSQKSHYQKYQNYNKNISQSSYSSQTAADMIRITQQKKQAIYKISSFGKSQQKILAHLRYITRNGKLELEDEDGNKLSQCSDRKELINRWSIDFNQNDRSRDTMHLVLSTPPGTDRQNALKACKDFLKEEYGKSGHEYVFVAHNDTNHPHIHAVIKMTSCYGYKLNPRKAYLRNVRKFFAKICREHNIDVEASSRCERGLCGPSNRSEFIHMKKSNRKPYKDLKLIQNIQAERKIPYITKHPSDDLMLKRNQIIRKRYAMKSKYLFEQSKILNSTEQKEKYFQASKLLERFAKNMPSEITRGNQVKQQLNAIYEISNNRTRQKKQNDEKSNPITEYNSNTSNINNYKCIYKSIKQSPTKNVTNLFNKDNTNNKRQVEIISEFELDLDN